MLSLCHFRYSLTKTFSFLKLRMHRGWWIFEGESGVV